MDFSLESARISRKMQVTNGRVKEIEKRQLLKRCYKNKCVGMATYQKWKTIDYQKKKNMK